MSSGIRTTPNTAGNQLAVLAIACAGLFVLAITALHVLRPDHDPIARTTSQYVGGPYGFLMTSAFAAIGLACAALATGLHRSLPAGARARLGIGFMGAFCVGALLAMIFPINPDGTPLTTAGAIHRVVGPITFLCLLVGVFFLSQSFARDDRWSSLHRPGVILSAVMAVFFVAMSLSIAARLGVAGLFQRLLLLAFLIWFFLSAWRLHSVTSPPDH